MRAGVGRDAAVRRDFLIVRDERAHPRAMALYGQVVTALHDDPAVRCYPGG